MWRDEAAPDHKELHGPDHEVVGYGISGRAELSIEDQMVTLQPTFPKWPAV